ncbi:putative membrane protein [Bacillus clarus]|uniref:Putative membrane protein n=1 Tax=Bacillus clarus TaxID=2338372 RepID=A0A090YLC1_9BACI|nr:putative membrane protein [Bacillus clarus]
MKSALTSIRCFAVGILNLFAYLFHFVNVFTLLFSIALLLVGAYFTKYIPISKKVH